MNWFFIALVAPFLWAFVNIADSYIVAKYSFTAFCKKTLIISNETL